MKGNKETLTNKVFWNTFWSAVEAIGRHGISFIIGIFLARLLYPTDYGLVGMLSIFIALSQVFIDCGFSNALICKKNISNVDYSTAFVFNFVIGVLSYILLYLIAPIVASFYKQEVLILLLRVLGLNVIFNSLCVVQNARLIIDYRIKVQTKISIICQISTGTIAIIAAYNGYGVWALALQSVSSSALTTIMLWIYAKWIPAFSFSKESFKYLWSFGSKMFLVGIISNIYSNIYSVIIGKQFNSYRLGLYNKAQSMSDLYPKLIYSFTNKVSLPTLAQFQDNPIKLKDIFRKYIRITAYVVFPIVGIMIVIAKPLIITLWSNKWEDSIILFQILCIGATWTPFNLFSLSILQASGRPDITLKLEFINKIVGVLIILLTLPLGLDIFVWGRALYCLYEFLINLNSTRFVINYKISEQIQDFVMPFALTIISLIITYIIALLFHSDILKLLLGGSAGILSYIGISMMLNVKTLTLIKGIYSQRNSCL